jgi:hypothetical protein
MKNQDNQFFRLDAIKEKNATYNVIYGERSNGKSYAVLEEILTRYCKYGENGAIIRRWAEDFKGKRGNSIFAPLVHNNLVYNLTGGTWEGVSYYSGRWYLCKEDENGKIIKQEDPFCYAFALTDAEHDKSTSYPKVTTILFDEFLSRQAYVPDEFVLFMNTLSTIIRYRDDVKIYMLGNTVNQYCPYFNEMGLKHVKQQKKGTIDVYTYGDSELTVAVQYADSPAKKKKSDKYFAFDNPKLKMITSGAWEIALYPHCPVKYKPKDIKFTFFIKFEDELLQCEVIMFDKYNFLFIHRKTTELKNTKKDLIYDTNYNPLHNYGRKITNPVNKVQDKISWYFAADKVFYQDNLVGEVVRNYINWSKTDRLL